MKTIKYLFSFCLVVLTFAGCVEDEKDLNFVTNVVAPSEVSMLFKVTQDNSGLVTITPIAEGAILFDITFGDETEEPSSLENGENVSHTYAEGTYTVSATAYGITGLETTVAQELVVSFKAPANLEVTIENDSAISKRVNVTATAEYAITFDVYSGVTDDTTPVSGNIGEVVALDYEEPGTYTITVVAKSAAIETVEYMAEFEVTAIVAPLTAAPTPPSRDAENVVSIYSDAYTDVILSEVNPGWGQSTVLTEVQVEENNTWFYSDLDYTGIVTDYGNATDVSAMEYVHFDYWTPDATVLGLKLVNTSYETGDPLKEHIEFVSSISLGSWVSVDIPLENFLNDTSGITQLLFDTTGNNAIVYIDNLYFYKTSSNTSGPTPITFETPYVLDGFDGGTTAVIANPDTNDNASASVLELVKGSGQPWAGSKITVPSPFSFAGSTTVSVKVWSPRAGLNLMMKFEDAVPWPNNTGSEEITVTTTVANQWQTLSFDHSAIDTTIDWYNMVLIMDNGTQGDGSADYTIYVDDISSDPILDFEPGFTLDGFDGGTTAVIANPDTNGNASASVLELVKGSGQPWAGSKITVPTPFSFEGSTTVSVKVWSPRAGLNLMMKFEDAVPWPNNTGSEEITVTTTVANQWQTLSFDHSAIDTTIDWYNMVLIMDNGTQGDGSADYTVYVDDISQN
ncbi:hypothetical protein N8341_01370 [Flavobacteriaceae bacterium]|nr:hypothetical protein [Flavobacteriaceae bacterium]